MSTTKKTIVRRSHEQIAAELQRRLAGLHSKINESRRRQDTKKKVLYGVGLLALNDPILLAKVRSVLSEADREWLKKIEDEEMASGSEKQADPADSSPAVAPVEKPVSSPRPAAAGASAEKLNAAPASPAVAVAVKPGSVAAGSKAE